MQPKRKHSAVRYLVYTVIAGLSGALLVKFGASLSGSAPGNSILSENPVREFLLSRAKNSRVLPTKEAVVHPHEIFDVDATKGVPVDLSEFFRGSSETESVRVKVNLSEKDRIQASLKWDKKRKLIFVAEDSVGRKLASCWNERCQVSQTFVPVSTSVVRISLRGDKPLRSSESIVLNIPSREETKEEISLPELDLTLSSAEEIHLRYLTKMAHTHKRIVRGKSFRTSIKTSGVASKVRVSVTGLYAPHYIFPPSMKVVVENGPALLGSQYFKLYRLNTRMGLLDYVANSVFADLGIHSPKKRLVKLLINGSYQGLYLFSEEPSPAFFENMAENESAIYRMNYRNKKGDSFTEFSYSVGKKKKFPSSAVAMEEPRFAEELDRETFARYIVAAILLEGTHGLSDDDLTLYRNRLDGRVYPYTNDLKVSLARPMESLLGVLSPNRPVAPSLWKEVKYFRNSKKYYAETGYFSPMTNIHPTVTHFLSNTKNRQYTEQLLIESINGSLRKTLHRRVQHLFTFVSEMLSTTNEEKELFRKNVEFTKGLLEKKDWQNVLRDRKLFLAEIEKGRFLLVNPMPFTVSVDGGALLRQRGAILCADSTSKFLMNPISFNPNAQRRSFNVKGLMAIYGSKVKSESLQPICEIRYSGAGRVASLLSASLSEGTKVPIEVMNGNSFERERLASDSPLQGKRVFLTLLGAEEDDSSVTYRYGYHRSHANLPFPKFSESKFFRSATGGDLDPVSISAWNVENAPRGEHDSDPVKELNIQLPETFQSPSGFFVSHSALIEVRVLKGTRSMLLHHRLEDILKEIHETLGPQGGEVFFLAYPQLLLARRTSPRVAESDLSVPEGLVTVNKTLFRLRRGTRARLDGMWHIRRGEKVVIEPGVELLAGENAGIWVEGELKVLGTQEQKVLISPLKKRWKGISFIDSLKENTLRHVKISGVSGFQYRSIRAFGGISVVRSHLKTLGLEVRDNTAQDAVNIYHGVIELEKTSLFSTRGDSVDSDFSVGSVDQGLFQNSLQDGLDLNQSFFSVVNTVFNGSRDKGISVGEKSVVRVQGSKFSSNDWGVAVKDSGIAHVFDSEFRDNTVALGEFVKKPWYTAPTIHSSNNTFFNNQSEQKNLGFNRY